MSILHTIRKIASNATYRRVLLTYLLHDSHPSHRAGLARLAAAAGRRERPRTLRLDTILSSTWGQPKGKERRLREKE